MDALNSTRKEFTKMGQPQHLEALERANRTRSRLYAIRRTVVARNVSLAAVILGELGESADPVLITLDRSIVDSRPVSEVLKWGWRIGPTVARRVLNTAEVAPTATLKLGDLGPARRRAIVNALEELAPDSLDGAHELEAIATAITLEATRPSDAAAAAA